MRQYCVAMTIFGEVVGYCGVPTPHYPTVVRYLHGIRVVLVVNIPPPSLIAMGNYRYIPEEQKKLIITMSLRGMKVKDIVSATGICKTTVCGVRRMWKATGEVVAKPLDNGRPRVLTALEVSVRAQFV